MYETDRSYSELRLYQTLLLVVRMKVSCQNENEGEKIKKEEDE